VIATVPRVAGDTCIRCRRKFQTGERITPVMIVLKTGHHPNDPREVGVHMSNEFELAHIDCHDPSLTLPILGLR